MAYLESEAARIMNKFHVPQFTADRPYIPLPQCLPNVSDRVALKSSRTELASTPARLPDALRSAATKFFFLVSQPREFNLCLQCS